MENSVLSRFSVEFDKTIFKTGQELSGKVTLTLNSSVKIRALIARFYGIADVG